MSDMMPTRPPTFGSPWAAPDPAHRHFGDTAGPPPPPGRRGPGPLQRALAAVVVLVLGLVLGLGGAAIIDHGRNSGRATTATTIPSAPATAPDTVTPGTDTPGTASPATTAPAASSPDTTTGGQTTSSRASLSVGVVDIDTVLEYQQAAAAGTGMVLTADGEVLTNNHVVQGATSISATVVSTGKTYNATVVGTDPSHDVAVIKLEDASGLTPANLGDSSSVGVGDAVTAVGNAGGRGGQPTVASGHVVALGQEITASDRDGSNPEQLTNLIQVDANLQPGESGGPLYNDHGAVIGIDTAGGTTRSFRSATGEGYAIPINDALTVARQIESGVENDTITIGLPGFLGIGLAPDANDNAIIGSVESGLPAEKIGLQAGDTLTNIDGKPITKSEDVKTALHGHHGGDKVSVSWTDAAGGTHKATATLVAGPAN
jgi:S1-C subfamily serine protease